MIVPSIDLMDGKAVQLRQGKEKVLEKENVLELARYYSRFGEVALIDLDCALNTGKDNEHLIKQICKVARTRVGGGIRDIEKARRLLSYGAGKLIIGTKASEEFLSQLPKQNLIVSIDTKGGKIATEGWLKTVDATAKDYIERFSKFVSGFLYTVVEKEGMMQGCDFESISEIKKLTDLEITAAGGISSVEEIVRLHKLGVSTQLGMCIYTDAVKLEDAFCEILNFDKQSGLIPTIVQDYDSNQVLMLAYSNKEACQKTLNEGVCTYFSRSRQKLWTKGETSKNFQHLVEARFDCDFDTLLYKVNQTGNACHLNRFSCFEDKIFSVSDLYKTLQSRLEKMPEKSFTTKLFKDRKFLNSKIMEEASEVCDFENGEDDLPWETADLTYFVLALMVQNEVSIQDVLNNLASRCKNE